MPGTIDLKQIGLNEVVTKRLEFRSRDCMNFAAQIIPNITFSKLVDVERNPLGYLYSLFISVKEFLPR